MKYNLKKPCVECPFRKESARGWPGDETVRDTFNAVINEQGFACHMTRDKPPSQMSRCRGSILFLKKACKLPKFDNELSEAIAKVKKTELQNILSVPEFFTHHQI